MRHLLGNERHISGPHCRNGRRYERDEDCMDTWESPKLRFSGWFDQYRRCHCCSLGMVMCGVGGMVMAVVGCSDCRRCLRRSWTW